MPWVLLVPGSGVAAAAAGVGQALRLVVVAAAAALQVVPLHHLSPKIML